MALIRSTDPLVWIDCEMTGLNPSLDTILSISCILTTSDLAPLDSAGFNAVISHTSEQLSQMSEWCITTHGKSGLTQDCLSSSTTAETAATQLLSYIEHYIPEPRRALLAGNSIHADRSFLMVPPWNRILKHLHYRLFDISAMKEMVRRWAGDQVLMAAPRKELRHTAREDVLESIQEAQYYRALIENITSVPSSMNRASLPASTTANSSINATANASIPRPNTHFAIVPSSFVPDPEAKHGQEIPRSNGTRKEDVEPLDQGFRTDVP